MFKHARVALVVMCVLIALGTHPFAAPSDVVLYAEDAINLHGSWTRISSTTGAGGQLLNSDDNRWGTTEAPLAFPLDYVEFTFSAVAGTPYHVWIRLRAGANSKDNDSVWAQFSDTVTLSGAPTDRIGSTTGLLVNLENCSACSPSGWGWQDGAYWLAQSSTVLFASTGSQTLRIQARKSGVQIDQVVLSGSTYLASRPGMVNNDATIIAKSAPMTPYSAVESLPGRSTASSSEVGPLAASASGTGSAIAVVPSASSWNNWTTVGAMANLTAGQQQLRIDFDTTGFDLARVKVVASSPSPPPPTSTSPTTYGALTDRIVRTKPALPSLGAAGFSFTDPTFGSPLLRVTDPQTRPNSPNLSYRTPSAGQQVAWSAASNYFFLTSTDGTIVPYSFDAAAMSAARISGPGDGGLTLNFYVEPEFSSTKPSVIYGVSNTGNLRTVSQFDLATGAYAPVIDLDTVISGLSGYVGGIMTGGTPTEYLMVFFGGVAQDQHRYLMWSPMNNLGARKIVDTVASTIDGVPTAVPLNFRIHAATIDRSGRYIYLYPTSTDLAAPRYASQAYLWDTSTNVITAISSGGQDGGPNALPGGHGAPGFGVSVNHDCCVASTWDGAQWIFRSLAQPLVMFDLIGPVQTPQEIYLSDHASWTNAQPNVLVPIIVGTYRYGNNTAPWRAWDDEIIAIQTSAPSAATVWRFAHHRSNIGSDSDPLQQYFWYEPRPNVSPDGHWVIFTSNWEKTLGTDPGTGTMRQDVFLLRLN